MHLARGSVSARVAARTRVSSHISHCAFQVLDEVHERSVDAEMLNYLITKLMESHSGV